MHFNGLLGAHVENPEVWYSSQKMQNMELHGTTFVRYFRPFCRLKQESLEEAFILKNGKTNISDSAITWSYMNPFGNHFLKWHIKLLNIVMMLMTMQYYTTFGSMLY